MSNPFDLTGALNTVFRQPPTPPPYDRFNWHGLSGKPYITVSAKGLKNGLSDRFNDGADFGVDTPNTKTSGLYEAVQYLKTGGHIVLTDGYVKFSQDAPLYDTGRSFDGKSMYAFIPLPSQQTNGGTPYFWRISGQGGLAGTGGTGNTNVSDKMSVIDITDVNTTVPSGATSCTIGTMSAGNNANTTLQVEDFVVYQSYPVVYGGIFGVVNYNSYARNITVTPKGLNFLETTFPTDTSEIGFALSGEDGNQAYIDNIAVAGNYWGISLNAHVSVGTIITQSCYYGLTSSTHHGVSVLRYDCQGNIHNIHTGSNVGLHIFYMDGEDYSASNVNYNQTAYDIYVETGTTGYNPSITVEHFLMGYSGGGSFNPRAPKVSNNSMRVIVIFKHLITNQVPALTLTANPPVSGTAYQNTNPYDIILYPRAYSNGTAGYIEVEISPDNSTYTSIIKDIVAAVNTSALPRTVVAKVPAGWWYRITITNSTMQNAAVVVA